MAKKSVFLALLWAGSSVLCKPSKASIPVLQQIAKAPSGDFSSLLAQWRSESSSTRTSELRSVSLDPRQSERTRYIALMGLVHLTSRSTSSKETRDALLRLHQDSSWVLRSATLEALQHLPPKALDDSLRAIPLKLLRDRALVVRSKAADTLAELKISGFESALIDAALAPENFHAGKALWIPQKALRLISKSQRAAGPLPPNLGRLGALLDGQKDPELVRLTLAALESLNPGEASRIQSLIPQNAPQRSKKVAQAWQKSITQK